MLKRYFRLVIAILFYFKINQLFFDERSNIILFITLIDFSFSFFFSKKKFSRLRAKVISALIPLRNEKNFLTRWKTHPHTLFHFFFAHIHTHSLSLLYTHSLKREGGEREGCLLRQNMFICSLELFVP
jgi:hypothetical protein